MRSAGFQASLTGGALDQDQEWRDVRPMHVNDPGTFYDDRRVRPMRGHDPRLDSASCPTCAGGPCPCGTPDCKGGCGVAVR